MTGASPPSDPAERRPEATAPVRHNAQPPSPHTPIDPLEARVRALAAVPPPPALTAAVQAQIEAERRAAPVRWTLAAASVAVWGFGLQQLVSWTAAQLATAV